MPTSTHIIPVLGRLRQEDEFKASLGYLVSEALSQKINKKLIGVGTTL